MCMLEKLSTWCFYDNVDFYLIYLIDDRVINGLILVSRHVNENEIS